MAVSATSASSPTSPKPWYACEHFFQRRRTNSSTRVSFTTRTTSISPLFLPNRERNSVTLFVPYHPDPDSYKPELAPEKPIIDMSGGEYDPTVLPASNGPEYPQSEYPPYPADPYYGYSDGYGYQPPGYWNYPPNDAYGGYAPEAYPAYPPNESTYPAGTDAAYYDGGKVPANTAYVTPEEKTETPKEPESQSPAATETPAVPAGESKPEEPASFPATGSRGRRLFTARLHPRSLPRFIRLRSRMTRRNPQRPLSRQPAIRLRFPPRGVTADNLAKLPRMTAGMSDIPRGTTLSRVTTVTTLRSKIPPISRGNRLPPRRRSTRGKEGYSPGQLGPSRNAQSELGSSRRPAGIRSS